MQFHATKIEFLVDNLYAFNRRLTTLGGQMLRLAERHKIKRIDFLNSYLGNEMDDAWIKDRREEGQETGPPSPSARKPPSNASVPKSPTLPRRPHEPQ